jgi:fermentation-respiration switch protein FrsA (DUF1100 family)
LNFIRRFELRQIYHPRAEWEAQPSDLGRPVEDLFITTPDGVKLSAWFFPAKEDSPRRNKVMLVCHGNGGNISHRLQLTRLLLGTGTAVLLFDYRGYGRSGGEPGEEGTYVDAEAAYQWLRQRGFAAQDIIAFGESLGGPVAAELALREPLGGVVLQSAFTSIVDVGRELLWWLPVRWLNTIQYDTRAKLARVKVPVLVMHSRDDTLVRFHHAERNFAVANEPKLFQETEGDHNDSLFLEPGLGAKGLEKFLRMIERRAKVS